MDNANGLEPWQIAWLRQFDAYALQHPDERASVDEFREFVTRHADAAQRELATGHLTGAAWLVSADGARVLLTHHRKLERWLQLGGHADGDVDLARVALREAEEESGLTDLVVEPVMFDLDRHFIPDRRETPGHWHYDVRYVVRCTGSETFSISDESLDLAWRDIAAMHDDPAYDASMRRMAGKWLARSGA
ncbi:MAG TPA: NUDIX hydrolase [Tahibacter sp.]|nr:NUDIX hydrolase [Tahibacter sp.]